ncbi:MAG: glycosyltransferase family 4 protein [Alphaproteobacteria bacterium]
MKEIPTVWLVNHYALLPGGSGGTRHYTLAKELKRLGWNPVVIAASTEANTGKQRLARGEPSRRETLDGVDFLWLRAPSYRGNGAGRLVNMACFALRLAFLPRRALPRPDVVLGSSPHPFAALAAWLQARQRRVPFVYEIRDLWPQSLVELGRISPKHPLMLAFGAIERTLCRKAARIVTLLPGVKDYLVPRGVAEDRIVWIPNGVDTSLFADVAPPPERAEFTFMYFGAHGNANGLDTLLRAMQSVEARDPSVHLRLIGDGPRKPGLEALARELGLARVSFEPPVAKQDIPRLAAEADAFVFILVAAPVFRKYGISANKLFDFMAAARPLVFACDAGNDPVAEVRAGVSVAAQDAPALAEAMLALAVLPLAERQAMGARGRDYVLARHDFAMLAKKLADTLAVSMAEKGR